MSGYALRANPTYDAGYEGGGRAVAKVAAKVELAGCAMPYVGWRFSTQFSTSIGDIYHERL